MDILEREIERKFVKEVKKRQGLCLKFVSPDQAGVPDRLVLMPGGKVYFTEFKAPGKKPRPLQRSVFRKFENLGASVFVIDSMEKVNEFFEENGGDADDIQGA